MHNNVRQVYVGVLMKDYGKKPPINYFRNIKIGIETSIEKGQST